MKGYKAISVIKLINATSAYSKGAISFKALRVYIACFELVAIREAARRSSSVKSRKTKSRVCYEKKELIRLTGGLSLRSIGKALKELERASVMKFSKSTITFTDTPICSAKEILEGCLGGRRATRAVPVPRRMLKMLSKLSKPTVLLTTLAYAIRGLSMNKNTLNSRGTVKASWIADTFGISLRGVKSARAELVAMGLISRDVNSYQRKLNRDGAYFELNLDIFSTNKSAELCKTVETKSKDSSFMPKTAFAPPQAKNRTTSAPPIEKLKTSKEIKNQKTRRTEPTGVCKQKNLNPPSLWNIIPDDLTSFSRNQELFFQAQARGLISGSEADILNWIASAVRARETENPCRIFMGILKKKLFHHITQAQEDYALQILKKKRAKNPDAYRRVRDLAA